MEPFDTVKIKKKGGLAWFSMPAEETVSMQLFSEGPHLVEFTAKQAAEVSSAYGMGGVARQELWWKNWLKECKRERNSGINVVIKCGNYTTIKDPANVFHRCFHLSWIIRTLLGLTVGRAMLGITPRTNKN